MPSARDRSLGSRRVDRIDGGEDAGVALSPRIIKYSAMAANKVPVQSTAKEPAKAQLGNREANPPRALNLPADFNALYTAASQDMHEWAAVDGRSASQEA